MDNDGQDFESGQSLLEVVIAVSVGILVVTALTFATIFSLRNANFAKTSAQATKLAQEGIERVRIGRDRNNCINNFGDVTPTGYSVNSWNGNSDFSACPDAGAIWNYQITGISSNCDNQTTQGKCYFNVNPTGVLTNIGFGTTFPTSTEGIPATNPVFKRVVLLSDDTNYATQKTVTVIVTWTDFSGPHESKLTTILRKL